MLDRVVLSDRSTIGAIENSRACFSSTASEGIVAVQRICHGSQPSLEGSRKGGLEPTKIKAARERLEWRDLPETRDISSICQHAEHACLASQYRTRCLGSLRSLLVPSAIRLDWTTGTAGWECQNMLRGIYCRYNTCV